MALVRSRRLVFLDDPPDFSPGRVQWRTFPAPENDCPECPDVVFQNSEELNPLGATHFKWLQRPETDVLPLDGMDPCMCITTHLTTTEIECVVSPECTLVAGDPPVRVYPFKQSFDDQDHNVPLKFRLSVPSELKFNPGFPKQSSTGRNSQPFIDGLAGYANQHASIVKVAFEPNEFNTDCYWAGRGPIVTGVFNCQKYPDGYPYYDTFLMDVPATGTPCEDDTCGHVSPNYRPIAFAELSLCNGGFWVADGICYFGQVFFNVGHYVQDFPGGGYTAETVGYGPIWKPGDLPVDLTKPFTLPRRYFYNETLDIADQTNPDLGWLLWPETLTVEPVA